MLKDAVSLLQQVTPQLLLAEVRLSLALGLRDSPAVATALGACPVLWPRLRSLPWAATPAGFTHTVAPMAALCRRGTGSATSPAHHRAGKARLEGPFGWKIRGVEPGGVGVGGSRVFLFPLGLDLFGSSTFAAYPLNSTGELTNKT